MIFESIEIEQDALSLLLRDPSHIDSVEIDSLFFTKDEYRYIFEVIRRYYEKFRTSIPLTLFEEIARKEKSSPEEIITSFVEITVASPIGSFVSYRDTLEDLYLKRKVRDAVEETAGALEKGGKMAVKILENSLGKIRAASSFLGQIKRRTISEGARERKSLYLDKKDHPENYAGIPTGFSKLDKTTKLLPTFVSLVFGRTSVGKSRFLFNVGYNAAKKGYHVMYCSLEMEINLLESLWDSRSQFVSLFGILEGDLSGEEELKYLEGLKKTYHEKPPFYTVDIVEGATPAMLEGELEIYRSKFGFYPDLILIDYGTLMNPNGKYYSGPEKHGLLYREFRSIARKYHTHVFSASQRTRESIKKKMPEDLVGVEAVSLSDQIPQSCDLVLKLFKGDPREQIEGMLFCEVVKNRWGPAGKVIEMFADFDHSYISDRFVDDINV